MQGLGTFPIVLAGTPQQRAELLSPAITGARIGAFALTEPDAGSDVGAIATTARPGDGGEGWVLEGAKTFISNAGIAAHYVVFARTGWDEARGRARLSAFVVEADTPGLYVAPLPMSVDHPIGTVRLAGCRVPAAALLGRTGDGFRLAMRTLDTFRITVGAAAVGMARRALDESLRRVRARRQFGRPIADFQMIQGYLADMATELDAARLLVYRAAWLKDEGAPGDGAGGQASAEVAMAKMYATEAAQRIIDRAVQIFGGLGVTRGNTVERLYREIRPLRIYEGTTEIQRLIIARALLDRAARAEADGARDGEEDA